MVNWEKSKQGLFTREEQETTIITNREETLITSSDTKMINKLIKLYAEQLEIKVLYFGVSSVNQEKFPTEVRVRIPKGRHVTLRKL